VTEWHNVILYCEELIGTAEYLMLQARCCLNRWRCDGVVLYIKRLKLQTKEKYTVIYWCNSPTQRRSDLNCDWRYMALKYSTLEHIKYSILTLYLNWKETYWEWSFLVFCTFKDWPVLTFRRNVLSSCTGGRNIVKVDDEFGRKNILATLEGCEDMWPIRAAELCRIHLNQVPSSRKKTCFW